MSRAFEQPLYHGTVEMIPHIDISFVPDPPASQRPATGLPPDGEGLRGSRLTVSFPTISFVPDPPASEGLVTRDKYGRLGGGARRALNIALHGTEKLQQQVRDGKISGELAEDLMTAAQCELGARPAEEQAALVDGILERANGDEALARRMLEKLTTDGASGGPEPLPKDGKTLSERLDQVAEEAKVDAIKERNGASDETARGAAVEPVETEDGQIKTVGEVVDADTSARRLMNAFKRQMINETHSNGGITDEEFQNAINSVPQGIREEAFNDQTVKALLDRRNEIIRQMKSDFDNRKTDNTRENKIALDRAQKDAVEAINAFVKNRPANIRAKEIDARDGTQLSGVVALADSIAKGNVRGRGTQQHFRLAKSNDILKANGLTGEYFTIKTSVITSHYGKDADHSLTPADWANVCEALQDPLVISKYREKDNAYRIWVETQINGHYAVVGVEVKSPGKDMTVNAVKTVFGDAKVDIKNDQIIYSRKNREGLRTLLGEPNSPEYSETPRVGDIIANSAANVNAEPKPTTALGGAEQADRLAGTKLTVFNGMTMGCETFPEAKVNVSADGVTVRGLTADTMAKPENVADVAAFLTHLMRISKRNGIRIEFEDADAAKIAQALVTEISQQGAAKTMAKLETRGKLFGILFKTTLGNGVTYDEAGFKEALKNVSNGRQFVDNHGDVYGFVDGEGVLHFNPATFRMDTPLHEYGHLALEATKKVNNALWKKGNALIKESQYYRDLLSEIGQDKNSPYREMDEEGLCDEALARMIGDRGAKLVEEKGLDAQLKGWLKEVWKAFKGALGIADLTEEQIERMTVGDFVDTINAELLKGSEFGTKKQKPLEKRSIKRYDEDQTSGSNGLLRWKNDRGYLFEIPVDMERTQPGGKVVFATDDANITDWIQNALHGYELRLSKSGKLYVKGRDGLPPELAEIFGRYPTIGQNDGIYGLIADETGNRVMDGAARDMTPEALVEALRKDRANYDAWTQGRDAEAEHWAMEEARENAEAAARWEQSGMNVMDYIRSRVEEGDPEFDLDWETAREIERDRAMGRFAIKRSANGEEYSYAALSTKPDMTLTPIDPNRFRNYGNKNGRKISDAKKSIIDAGGFVRDGHYYITLDGEEVEVGSRAITHGIHNLNNEMIFPVLGNVIKNAVKVNELNVREKFSGKGQKDENVSAKFVYLGAAAYGNEILPVRIQIDQRNGFKKIESYDVLKSFNTKIGRIASQNKNAPLGVSISPNAPATISIANLIGIAQPLHPQIFSRDVANALGVSYRGSEINAKYSAGNRAMDGAARNGMGGAAQDLAFDPAMIVYNPKLKAMGETEQNAGGLAAAIEKKEALRPWTRKDSPCDLAKPIAMDMADMVQFIRAINGAARTPIIRKGEHIPGRPNAIGLNRGGTQIELANRLFGMVDASDVGKLKTDCANEGYFRHENADWCATQPKDAVKAEAERSQLELDRRTRELIRHRVATGEGGMHYATQVLGHEIGHTIATLPADRNLGAVGNAMRTLFDSLQREMKRVADPLRAKKDEPNLAAEIDNLITWWHGADALPDYYKKPKEKFAELFGIFLTQPESVHREAPKAYEAIGTFGDKYVLRQGGK